MTSTAITAPMPIRNAAPRPAWGSGCSDCSGTGSGCAGAGSGWGAIGSLGLVGTDAVSVARAFSVRTPARAIGGYYVFVAAGLSAVWLGTWAAYVFAGRPTPVATEAFHLVAALDMTLMVPALVTGGVLLWRRRPWGYVIAAAAGIQASLYLLVLSVNSVVSISRSIVAAPGELPIWGTLMVLTFTATVWLVRACDARKFKFELHHLA